LILRVSKSFKGKLRQHSYTKRWTWRKLHIGADESTGEIVAAVVTTSDCADSQVLADLQIQVPHPLQQVNGTSVYDKRANYMAVNKRGTKAVILPRKNAKIWQRSNRKEGGCCAIKTCVRFAKSGSSNGKRKSGITDAALRRRKCSG
jgi:hypothetical protein